MTPDHAGKQPSRKEFKQALSRLSRDELIKLVGDLYSAGPDNRRFLEARFALGDAVAPYKKLIEAALYPDVTKDRVEVSFSKARKAISDFKKAVGDPKGIVELMVSAVEWGNSFTVEYGDIDEDFYDNLESLFRKTVQVLKNLDQQTIAEYLPRMKAVVEAAHGIGWGYHDGIADALYAAFPPE